MNVLINTNIRLISSRVLPTPFPSGDPTSVPNRSIQKHSFLRESFSLLPLIPPNHTSIHAPLDHVAPPRNGVLVEPLGGVEPQMVDLFVVPGAPTEEVCLYEGPVAAQKLEVDLVLGLVALLGGEVEVEVETVSVAAGALDESREGAGVEAHGRAPPRAAADVVGEGDGVGDGTVRTGLGSVVDGDLLQWLGGVRERKCIRHCWSVCW
ncbi:hypothetical protein V8G54_009317 [Vigna mungo]|uniref:Uncharacterized protein n=1 Tax=Vigna mungo TaxID=3915 RepID=A0AAQ3NU91_VIGMU